MEKKSPSLIPMFVVVLVLGFTLGNVDGSRTYLTILLLRRGFSMSSIGLIGVGIGLISFIINPVLVFIGAFFTSRIDLKAKLTSLIVRLLVGAYIGYSLGYVVTGSIIGYSVGGEFMLSSLSGFFSLRFLHLFFVALAACAIAYIRRS